MGQFDRFIDRRAEPPPLIQRAISVVVPIGWVVKAVLDPTFENILGAVFLVALLLPAGIAPKPVQARLAAWNRDRPILSGALGLMMMACASFLLARWLLDRTPSVVVAIAVVLIAFLADRFRRRRRNSPAG